MFCPPELLSDIATPVNASEARIPKFCEAGTLSNVDTPIVNARQWYPRQGWNL